MTASQIARRLFVCLVLVTLGAGQGTAAEIAAQLHHVAMSDGVKLATDVYLPTQGQPPFPVILMRGPYGRSGAKSLAADACRRGYALVSQDVRGRGDSEGSAVPIFGDGGLGAIRDGHETITWITSQAWCDGHVGSTGGSALGVTQNMQAPGAPPALGAQVVEVAFSNMYAQGAYQGGVWRKELIENWLNGTGLAKENQPLFRSHPHYDAFWKELDPEAFASRVTAPAIFIGGWYDIFIQGTINSFTTIQHGGGEPARGSCQLILGPWAHGPFTELTYPANSHKRPLAANPYRFFEHWLRGEANSVPEDKCVHYYLMGDPTDSAAPGNQWRTADDWPPPADSTPYYLHPAGKLVRGEKPATAEEREYRYDPNDSVPTVGGQNLFLDRGPMDQRKVESRQDVLLFETDALAEPLEVVGPIVARLFVASDRPDTDFTVKLCDVYPDGRSMLVTDGILRASFREGFDHQVWLEQEKTYEVMVDLWSTAIVFNRGHRLRIAVSSSNAPRFEPNPNTGPNTEEPPHVANNTLYLSSDKPSHILLPIAKPSEQAAR